MALVGIDIKIEKLRLKFENNLFSGLNYSSYGRAFLNKREGKIIPEIQIADTTNYLDVLQDTLKGGLSFFVVDSYKQIGASQTFKKAIVSIYFAVNLDKLYSTVAERAVESLHRDVLQQLKYTFFDQEKISEPIVSGLKAFKEFGMVKPTDDMEPFYLVRFRGEIQFYYNQC